MFFLCLHGFSLGLPASPPVQKHACESNSKFVCVNGHICLFVFPSGIEMNWPLVQVVTVPSTRDNCDSFQHTHYCEPECRRGYKRGMD